MLMRILFSLIFKNLLAFKFRNVPTDEHIEIAHWHLYFLQKIQRLQRIMKRQILMEMWKQLSSIDLQIHPLSTAVCRTVGKYCLRCLVYSCLGVMWAVMTCCPTVHCYSYHDKEHHKIVTVSPCQHGSCRKGAIPHQQYLYRQIRPPGIDHSCFKLMPY